MVEEKDNSGLAAPTERCEWCGEPIGRDDLRRCAKSADGHKRAENALKGESK